MIPILRVRDENGNIIEIPAIKGEPGVGMDNITASDVKCADGKTVEEQLAELWQGDASMADAVGAHSTNEENPHGVTAAQAGAIPYRGYATDLNAILTENMPGYYGFSGSTAHTPYSEGATGAQAGIVLNIPDNGYGYTQQVAFFKGSMTPLYRYTNGDINSISRWADPFLRHDGGDVTGNVSIRGHLNAICNAGGVSFIGDNHVFLQFLKNGLGTGRSGYMGYGSEYSTDFTICNEMEGGALKLDAKAGVYIGGAKVPRVYQSTAAPTAADGSDGDVWHQYV